MKDFKKAKLSMNALVRAYFDCIKHKATTKQAMDFEYEREKNLSELYTDIESGEYKIGKSICFIVSEPKPREVWAGCFRDRIVHHLIHNAIYDRYVSKFIYDTYSCLVKKGTLAGALRAEKMARKLTQNYSKKAYFCKMDITNYFVSINKDIMFNLVTELVDKEEEKWLYDLIYKVIYHDPRKDVCIKSPRRLRKKLPKHKSLFNSDDIHGLPIGNLTSQFFSNIYLNGLDQYAKHVLKCKNYIRYVDDIIIMDEDPGFLNYAYSKINRYLIDNLELKLNHKKKNINTLDKGFDFLGLVIKPNCKYIRHRTKNKCYKLIENWENKDNRFESEVLLDFRSRINSYLGFLVHTNSYQLRGNISDRLTSLMTRTDRDHKKFQIMTV